MNLWEKILLTVFVSLLLIVVGLAFHNEGKRIINTTYELSDGTICLGARSFYCGMSLYQCSDGLDRQCQVDVKVINKAEKSK